MDFIPVLNDKGAGYQLVPKSQMHIIQHSLLNSALFEKQLFALDFTSMAVNYMRLSKRIGAAQKNEDLPIILSRSLNQPGARACARLDFTVKGHKPVGEVTCRPLHAVTKWTYSGIV